MTLSQEKRSRACLRGAGAIVGDERRIGGDAIHERGERLRLARAEEQAGVLDHFAVLRLVVHQRAVAESHRLDQRRMRPAHLRGVHVGQRVALQLAVAVPVDSARKQHPGARRLVQALFVFSGIWGVADNHEPLGQAGLLVGGNHGVRVVFGLQAADVEKVAVGFEAEPIERGAAGVASDRDSHTG